MDQQAMGEIGVKLGPNTYNASFREGNTFTTYDKCFNKHIMLQINISKKLKWNLDALIKN
jgi:hypothetical protein